jgi:Mg2+ and Co2+ transporter CorA
MQSFDELADEVASIESRVSDAIYDALRAQVNEDEPDNAKELERRLSKVRRSLQKAESLLRGASDD